VDRPGVADSIRPTTFGEPRRLLDLRDTEVSVFWTTAGSASFVAVLDLICGGRKE
jgi:hypothetical protein